MAVLALQHDKYKVGRKGDGTKNDDHDSKERLTTEIKKSDSVI